MSQEYITAGGRPYERLQFLCSYAMQNAGNAETSMFIVQTHRRTHRQTDGL